ncbi:MAG: phenylalanine--tRNA ligase subunit alpha [delta proteobacterium ML8_F1]|nr:MAG: phenylalanine--tRNA ligase subunit alpha [delta proteobacterium ML8_F1]
MESQLKEIVAAAEATIEEVTTSRELDDFRVHYLGKKGVLKELMKGMGKLSPQERPQMGKLGNEATQRIEELIAARKVWIKSRELDVRLKQEAVDITMPGDAFEKGHLHPLNLVLNEIKEIFIGMGYKIAEGPEVDTVYNNFDALNSPKDHPSRSLSDTFYINEELLLRTQTSPVQVRTMMANEPPIKVISPGRCFRYDELDATHSPMFHQIEGLVVDEQITMADLKGTLDLFAKRLFGEKTRTKFRPHYFPFTEPSAEVDVSCFKCGGEGCRFCSYSGWIEILGCGMVHPHVLEECGIDSGKYSGFAFGMGLDRITMLKHEIDDIRLFFENDIRFIKQF